jgi:hypothetical protein
MTENDCELVNRRSIMLQPMRKTLKSRRRGGPLFGDQVDLFSIVKVQTEWPKWPSFR